MSFFGSRNPAPGNQPGNSAGPARDIWGQKTQNEPDRTQQRTDDNANKDDKNNKNDNGIDDSMVDDIWKVMEQDPKSGAKDDNNNNNNQAPVDPQKQMTDYLASVGLDPIVLSDAEKAELQSGNFENVLSRINQKIAQSHVKSLSGTKTLIEEAVRTAVEKAVGTSAAQREGQRNKDALNAALPWTKDPALGPIAQTVMQRFLDRGKSTEEAIQGVKLYAARMSKMAGDVEQVNRNRNGNFSGNRSNTGDEGAESWLDVLSPQSR